MLKKCRSYECECGSVHELNTADIVVSKDAFSELLKELKNNEIKDILILSSIEDLFFIEKIKTELHETNKNIQIVNLIKCTSSILLAEKIEHKGQSLVVALGSEELISVAKYYSYMYNSELIIFPVGNFVDYTFSKFARLFDGVEFAFYLTVEPVKIYVSTILNTYNELQTHYISSKYLSYFDSIIAETTYRIKSCEKINEFFKKILSSYLYEKNKDLLNGKNIWALIRLGQAMSYFNQTKYFFGGELAISNLLQSQNVKADFLEINTISVKIVLNMYTCFFQDFPKRKNTNLNKQLLNLSMLIKVSSSELIKRMVGSEFILGEERIFNRFSNYYHYLKTVLNKSVIKIFRIHSHIVITDNFIKKYNFSAKRVEKTFALAHCLFFKPCCLHLFSAYGNMDILL